MHIDYAVKPNCYNPMDSMGEICTMCNCCGRVDKTTMHQCRVEADKRHLINEVLFLCDKKYQNCQAAIISNCGYYIKRIKRSMKKLGVGL